MAFDFVLCPCFPERQASLAAKIYFLQLHILSVIWIKRKNTTAATTSGHIKLLCSPEQQLFCYSSTFISRRGSWLYLYWSGINTNQIIMTQQGPFSLRLSLSPFFPCRHVKWCRIGSYQNYWSLNGMCVCTKGMNVLVCILEWANVCVCVCVKG